MPTFTMRSMLAILLPPMIGFSHSQNIDTTAGDYHPRTVGKGVADCYYGNGCGINVCPWFGSVSRTFLITSTKTHRSFLPRDSLLRPGIVTQTASPYWLWTIFTSSPTPGLLQNRKQPPSTGIQQRPSLIRQQIRALRSSVFLRWPMLL